MTLEEKIKYHQNLYYNHTPEISDEEFDALWDKLKKESPESKLLKEIGDTDFELFKKEKHLMVMGSQDKFNNEKDFKEWVRIKKIIFPLLIQYKLDGLSVELQYEKGKFIKALSRGNGEIGENITFNVNKMEGVPKRIDNSFSGAIRGEILLKKDKFEKYFKEAKNPRNMASGITKRKDGKESEYLNVIVYDVLDLNKDFTEEIEKIKFLKNNNFDVVKNKLANNEEDVINIREEVINNRNKLNIAIDGIVLKQNKIVKNDINRKRPEFQRAFKFETEQAITKLKNVVFDRNGYNYTPVAEIDPVELMGTVVKRASLANLDNIKKLDLCINDEVLIIKSGDIIPKIIKVVDKPKNRKKINPPITCEICESDLVISGARIYCPNKNCEGRKFHKIVKWIEKTEAKGFGEALLNFLFENGFVEDIIDLYNLNLNELLEATTLKKATKKAFEDLYSKKTMKLEKFISGFDIEGIGEGVVKFLIEEGYDTFNKMKKISYNELLKINGFSDIRAKQFLEAIKDNEEEMEELLEVIDIIYENKNNKLNNKSFCFTGKLNNFTRKQAEDIVKNNGGKISGVNKNLDYLVNNDKNSNSSKNKKGKELKIKIITEEEFIKLLNC